MEFDEVRPYVARRRGARDRLERHRAARRAAREAVRRGARAHGDARGRRVGARRTSAPAARTKREAAAEVAAARRARARLASGDRVGLLLFTVAPSRLRPAAARPPPRAPRRRRDAPPRPRPAGTDLARGARLPAPGRSAAPRSVFLLSDFAAARPAPAPWARRSGAPSRWPRRRRGGGAPRIRREARPASCAGLAPVEDPETRRGRARRPLRPPGARALAAPPAPRPTRGTGVPRARRWTRSASTPPSADSLPPLVRFFAARARGAP